MWETNEISLRLEALRLAVKVNEIHGTSSEGIVDTAEQFYEFLTAGEEE